MHHTKVSISKVTGLHLKLSDYDYALNAYIYFNIPESNVLLTVKCVHMPGFCAVKSTKKLISKFPPPITFEKQTNLLGKKI